jgi:hypothetical protein
LSRSLEPGTPVGVCRDVLCSNCKEISAVRYRPNVQ